MYTAFAILFLYDDTMEKELKLLRDFHEKFSAGVSDTPRLLEPAAGMVRYRIMHEEVAEYLAGVEAKDLPNIAKELADILYATYGTIVAHGLQDAMPAIFAEIHRSNMTKEYHPEKAKKGAAYEPANIDSLLPRYSKQ